MISLNLSVSRLSTWPVVLFDPTGMTLPTFFKLAKHVLKEIVHKGHL